ncbi:MAG: CRISPR-associated endoribonuclease Cas6 [Armatimonadetes bacterium]|nr:CRISPR-associated endoribonuclease Cas6 [Armatimonadota bacterium]
MRLKLYLGERRTPFTVPLHYNYFLQSLIYHHLDAHLAERLHNEGFGEGGKRFRFFVFSRLMGDFQREGDHLRFPRGAILYIASPNSQFLESLMLHLLTQGALPIGETRVPLHKVLVEPQPEYHPEVIFKALSPITLRETLRQPGEKYTYYYSPIEPDFSERIIANLREKVRIWFGRDIPPGDAYCVPYAVDLQKNFHMINFKGTWVKGWSGLYRFHAPPEYFEMALEAGIGERNSGGFGCVEVYGGTTRR